MYRDYGFEAQRQALSYLNDLVRMGQEIVSKLEKVFEYLAQGDREGLNDIYTVVRQVDTSIKNFQRTILTHVMKYKYTIPYSATLYQLVTKIGDIADHIDGALYRLSNLDLSDLSEWEISLLREMADNLVKQYDIFSEAVYLYISNASVIPEYIDKIISLENEIDRIYRNSLAKVFKEEDNPINIIKWLHISTRLEEAADDIERAADLLALLLIS